MKRLFSGLKAALTFGRAEPAQQTPAVPAKRLAGILAVNEPLQRLREAQAHSTADFQNRRRAEAEAFERDCQRAEKLLAGRPDAQASVDAIRITSGIKWDATTKALKAEPEARRGNCFDHILTLKATFGWTLKTSQYGARSTDSRFGTTCECLIRDLIDMGFEMNAARASAVLRLIAAGESGHALKGRACWSARELKLGAVREMEKALRKGQLALSTTDRQLAREILATMHEGGSKEPKGPEKGDSALVKQLKAIAGADQQETFFARMRPHAAPPFMNPSYTAPSAERIDFWQEVLVQAADIVTSVRAFAEDRASAPAWTSDRGAFEAKFGKGHSDKAFRFGWWSRDTAGEEGFDPKFNNHLSRLVMDGPAANWPTLLTAERIAQLKEIGPDFAKSWPPSYATPAVPHVADFAFEGRDADGALFNLFEQVGEKTPGPTWYKSTDAALAAIGHAEVLAVLKRWVEDYVDPSVDIDWQTYSDLASLDFPSRHGNAHYVPDPLPEAGSDAWRRMATAVALKVACGNPGVVMRREATPHKRDGSRVILSDHNVIVARGIAFALSRYPAADAVPLLEALARHTMSMRGWSSYKTPRAGAACVQALAQLGYEGAFALGRLRRAIRDKTALNAIDRALATLGGNIGLSTDDMHEIAMADWGVGDAGSRTETLGDLTVELRIVSSRKAELRTTDARGKATRGVSKAFKELEGGKELAEELEEAAADIAKILPEARRRIEAAWRTGRTWSHAGWTERLIDNGLLRTVTERLIWRFMQADGTAFTAIPQGGKLLKSDGSEHAPAATIDTVALWHPMDASAAEVAAWRKLLVERKLTQPFIQAWRPVYPVTEAERVTATYSNRFAGHILEQAPAMAILKKRGWIAFNRSMQGNNAEHERVRLLLPHFGVAAEYWVAGIGSRIQEGKAAEAGGELFAFINTDRTVFYALDARTGKPGTDPLPVADVHPTAFGEVMYDIDSVVGRTSIGADRFWNDRGQGAAHPQSEEAAFVAYRERYASGQSGELADARHDFLESVLPGLTIADQCTLTPKFLMVDGKRHTYKISLSSGNILIAPNDRYLCIVRAGDSSVPRGSYVPFEGDDILSIILSKAMMLADDDKIDDQTILRQLA